MHTVLLRATRGLLASLLVFAALAVVPIAVAPSAHSEMNHNVLGQGCLSGCANNSLSQPITVYDQQPSKEQNEDPKHQSGPYYVQFMHFRVPRKLTSQTNEAAYILKPPDLVKLYATFRD